MAYAKRYCKLIFSTIAMALCFIAFSLPAFADPLTSAMMTSGFISGVGFTQIAGAPFASSGAYSLPSGYSDPLDWDDSANWTNGEFKVRISESSTSGNVDVSLSNGIATNGYARLNAIVSHYGLQPGQVQTINSIPSISGYLFYNKSGGIYYGGDLGVFAPDTSYVVANNIYWNNGAITSSQVPYQYTIGTYSTSGNISPTAPAFGMHMVLYYRSSLLAFGTRENFNALSSYNSYAATTEELTVSRDIDSIMTDPVDNNNVVTIPSSYVSSYESSYDTDIATKSDVEAILNAIFEAYSNDDVEDSAYLPPPGPAPTPVPGDTIADTPYSDLHGDLGDVSDTIGIGNGVLEDIKDILDNTTDGLKDTVEDISDALTSTVDGIKKGVNTISQTLTGIASHVAELVQEIVDADYNWTSGVINNFFNAFTDWFSTLRSHVSIWHYVVEWLSDISTCFAFFWGVQSAAGYRFILPIYAAFAGTVVIAIYRRFGK